MAKVPGSTPEEWDRAGRYVAIIDEMVEPTGYEYVDKKSGYRLGITAVIFTWKVTVCDIQEQRRIAENTFRGDPPPQELPDFHSTPNGIYGIQPARQMDAWLASLKAQ